MGSMTCRELSELMASNSLYAVFDVRERGEYNARQISFATSLPRSQIEFRIAELAPNRDIALVVYDEGGERAALAAQTLSELGYTNVSVLDGGPIAWEREGGPVVSLRRKGPIRAGRCRHLARRAEAIARRKLRDRYL